MMARWAVALAMLVCGCGARLQAQTVRASLDLKDAVIVARAGDIPIAEHTAAVVLSEEVEKRTGLRLPIVSTWPAKQPVIAVSSAQHVATWPHQAPMRVGENLPERRPEGFHLVVQPGPQPVVWIVGADPRGVLYGVGALLRRLDWQQGHASVDATLDLNTAPHFPIRGHQLGYRPQANSYDTWSIAQYEQYIRELTFFGINSVEMIPFPEGAPAASMKVPIPEMNRAIGEICQRYGLDYWVWTPAPFRLTDSAKRAQAVAGLDAFFHSTPTLSAVFFPTGDPGSNPPELVLPYVQDIAKSLLPLHPKAKVWLSLQNVTAAQVDTYFAYIDREKPAWLGGLVVGPGSTPIQEVRRRLPANYGLRLYPDVTHNKLSEFEVPLWDEAFALTEGRQTINPRPREYARLFHQYASYADGFIAYSDGAHDDVNKTIWSALAWDSERSVREILDEYAHVFFCTQATEASDGMLALENNWHGALLTSGVVPATLRLWQQMERNQPQLSGNWRWQMCLLRAYLDADVQQRLIHETELEKQANRQLLRAGDIGAGAAMEQAVGVLREAETQPAGRDLRDRVEALCEALYRSIGFQTSVEKYGTNNPQRGPLLDFLDLPLNNRWWMEDELAKAAALASEPAKVQRLAQIATWEHPGPGSFYDAVGDLNKSPDVVRCDPWYEGPGMPSCGGPTVWWWNKGKSRARLSAQTTMWPIALTYTGLDPHGKYVVRTGGAGQVLLRINGERVQPLKASGEFAAFKDSSEGKEPNFTEFAVPAAALHDRSLVLTWDVPTDEAKLSWHDKSRLAEVWLLKQ